MSCACASKKSTKTGTERAAREIRLAGRRVAMLTSLREIVALPPAADIEAGQWTAILDELAARQRQAMSLLATAEQDLLPFAEEDGSMADLGSLIGRVELDLAGAFILFDLYVDVLSQRHLPGVGGLLGGCDVLADDALRRSHLALRTGPRPLVQLQQGFGAATRRQRVPLRGGTRNPLQLIEIPYTRLGQKYLLTSIAHEVGHEVMVRLQLLEPIRRAVVSGLALSGSGPDVPNWFGAWLFELIPDAWTVICCGLAAAAGLADILLLPADFAYRADPQDPHPPPFLRVLIGFEMCRQVWGPGPWDPWEDRWRRRHPLDRVPAEHVDLIAQTLPLVRHVVELMLGTPLRAFDGGSLIDLMDRLVAPDQLRRRIRQGHLDLRGLRPCAQLAVFRLAEDDGLLDDEVLDRTMTTWLQNLQSARSTAPTTPAHSPTPEYTR